jgi:hypothetical protein
VLRVNPPHFEQRARTWALVVGPPSGGKTRGWRRNAARSRPSKTCTGGWERPSERRAPWPDPSWRRARRGRCATPRGVGGAGTRGTPERVPDRGPHSAPPVQSRWESGARPPAAEIALEGAVSTRRYRPPARLDELRSVAASLDLLSRPGDGDVHFRGPRAEPRAPRQSARRFSLTPALLWVAGGAGRGNGDLRRSKAERQSCRSKDRP